MCKKCSFDVGAGYKNNCECKCEDTEWVDFWKGKGEVHGCSGCGHLIDGFFKVEYEEAAF